MSDNRMAAYGKSAGIAIALAALTVIEYYAAIHFQSTVVLFLLALFKAVLVLNFFMHVSRLWKQEEGH
jgi:cytochrome c oxidase subunit 4